MNIAVKNMIDFLGIPLTNAAKMIGFAKTKGSFESGKDADIAVLDRDFNVQSTIVKGKVIATI